MTDDKKIELDEPTVGASGPIAESDPVIDEMVVVGLQLEVRKLETENLGLYHQIDAMGDLARMNCASSIFAALIGAKGEIPMNTSNLKRKAIDAADSLISHYQETIEGKVAEHQKRLADMEPPEDEPVN